MAADLFGKVREWVPRERRFQILVLANLCAVIARELRAGAEPSLADARLFRELLRRPVEPAIAPEEADAVARATAAELASLGRRICEPEWDALQLLPVATSASRPGVTGSGSG